MQAHPYAALFPLIDGEAFRELVEDIREQGVREPIWTYQEQILDGRNRHAACVALGIDCPTREYRGNDPLGFVVSLNLRRRHLDESQRSMIAAKIATLPRGANQHAEGLPIGRSAEMLNVGERSVARARAVLDRGDAALVRAVESGRVSVAAAADVAELPKQKQAEIVARGEREILEAAKQIRAERAEVRRAERIEKVRTISEGNADLPTGRRYPVIYADPPWRYEHIETESRAIENQYPTMALEDICAMPVADLATDDAVLFLWATSPKLAEAMQVLESWGFTYRTCAVWAKPQIGMGYYFRQQHELLLVATRGSLPTPAPSDRPGSVITADRTKHSAKPAEFAAVIESMYPTLPRVELFCRTPRAGWDVWGNQSAA